MPYSRKNNKKKNKSRKRRKQKGGNIPNYNIFYINLDNRIDRRQMMENEYIRLQQFPKIKVIINRFSAIKSDIHGGIGCAKSHIAILKKAKQLNLPNVMIMEDDIKIKFNILDDMFKIINNIKNFDVLILSGWGHRIELYKKYDKAWGIQTTGWYLVNNHYYDTLIDIFQESVDNMESLFRQNQNINYHIWSIDQNWKKLQKKDNWLILKHNLGYQYNSYSDIEHTHVDYTKLGLY
jgi:glycosyl transferase, family 25